MIRNSNPNAMILYGTITSPFVRRVRIVLKHLKIRYNRVDTSTQEGQKQLREVSPIWKVPTLDTRKEIIFDSHMIIDWLISKFDSEKLLIKNTDNNLIMVADGILDSGINMFYLAKENILRENILYLQKQYERITAQLDWLEQSIEPSWYSGPLNYSTIALISAIDWLKFRKVHPLDEHLKLLEFSNKINLHGIIKDTLPN